MGKGKTKVDSVKSMATLFILHAIFFDQLQQRLHESEYQCENERASVSYRVYQWLIHQFQSPAHPNRPILATITKTCESWNNPVNPWNCMYNSPKTICRYSWSLHRLRKLIEKRVIVGDKLQVINTPKTTASKHLMGKAWRKISRATSIRRRILYCFLISKNDGMQVWLYPNDEM